MLHEGSGTFDWYAVGEGAYRNQCVSRERWTPFNQVKSSNYLINFQDDHLIIVLGVHFPSLRFLVFVESGLGEMQRFSKMLSRKEGEES